VSTGATARALVSLPDVGLERRVDARTAEVLRRRRDAAFWRRGWVLRRALLFADVVGLTAAFALAAVAVAGAGAVAGVYEAAAFAASLPLWVVLANLHGLYDRDDERANHTTVDDFVRVFHLVTTGVWLLFLVPLVLGVDTSAGGRLAVFWLAAVMLVPSGRAVARASCRKSVAYIQNTIIVGAGEIGQLIARKLMQHPEYGLNLVGFVDTDPKERREEIAHVALLGDPSRLPEMIKLLDVERVVIAFSNEPEVAQVELIRSLRDLDVQIDLVPRLFEIVGPNAAIHSVEGLPLVGLPAQRAARSSRFLKRVVDVVGASVALVLTSPLIAFIAWRVRRDSPGPILFRQARLGMNMREFTLLKFRTMYADTSDDEHREYIAQTMSSDAALGGNGLYKLDRTKAVTPFGRWLRKTSLDELPQLFNVLRGDMSLVGPRPCLAYETESFQPHQLERFLVPAGITGLWQVTARANSTFGEALDLDVAYVRSWSLGLDLRLLLKTPFEVLRQRRSTA